MAVKKNASQAEKDAKNRDLHISYLANWWGESFACTKESLLFVSDRDVRIMANSLYGGEVR